MDKSSGLVASVRTRVRAVLGYRTYSQEGEDRILWRLFERQPRGFYVDVGAHHPHRFSNTYLFYRHGWRGINIDAMPGSMELFRKMRPRDTNIEVGIAEQAGKAQFFVFDERALNTFDPALAELRNKPPYKLEQVVEVPIRPLRDVLREHMPAGTRIDFLTVDVEGRDYDVLASNDWESFRPGIVLVEAVLGASVADLQSDVVVKFLSERNYELVAKTVCTCIFVDRSAPASAP